MNNDTEKIFLSNPSKEAETQDENEPDTSRINLENIEDFTNVCRTCAAVTEFVVPIFIGEGLQNKLAEKIHKYLSIQVSEEDVLPQVVCYQCVSTLISWHDLVQNCTLADTALKKKLTELLEDENSKIHEKIYEMRAKGKLEAELSLSNVRDIIIKTFQIADANLLNSGLEFLCETCDNQLPTLNRFVEHLRSQHNNDCKELTTETFLKENVSIVEMLIEDPTTDVESDKEVNEVKLKRFRCPFCESSFSSPTRLICHLNRHIEVCIEDGVNCCDTLYHDTKLFVKHLEIAHVKKKNESNSCRSCGFTANDKDELKDHITKLHVKDEYVQNKDVKHRDKWQKTPSSGNYEGTYRSRFLYKNEIINDSKKNIKLDTLSTSSGSVAVGDDSDNDDRPLAAIANEKSNDLYKKFYNALVNFRNHYVIEHEKNTSDYLDFSDSSDSEVIMEDRSDGCNGDEDMNNFDDLSEWNMRKGKMDEETRLELNDVQRKIDGKVFFACKICDKNLSTVHTYIFHKRIHTGERPCVCHVCGKQFRTPNGLQRHLTETHQRLRRHSCSFCPKNFANTQNLKQHLRIHTGERPFVCSHCGKRFTQSGSLHVHLKTHSEQYPFQCAECGAKFRLRSGLTRHRLKHTGERPHVCVHCGKAFRQKHDLHSHALAHTNPKPHACLVCGAAFRQLRALKHHYKRVHQSEPPKQLVNDSVFNHVGQYQ
ncbi:Zinc finger protein 782 [Papilio xuthus]|uniref:Zinc finger protein 782 n=2 Tax=Papilio xuthus TaxID=66420 RepID=A0A194PFS0_PAPXU|nr:Zinc finger protein 782 [Papilio xuthus]